MRWDSGRPSRFPTPLVRGASGLGWVPVEMIAFLAAQAHSGRLRGPVLIVAPATVLSAWVGEFQEWAPAFRAALLHASGSHDGRRSTLLRKVPPLPLRPPSRPVTEEGKRIGP